MLESSDESKAAASPLDSSDEISISHACYANQELV